MYIENMNNKLLVIIVTYNAMQWIDQCLGSVLKSTMKSDIFIVDNGSSDGTQEYIKHHYSKDVLFLESKENLGFGRANNMGLQYALDNGYDFAYLLNQDAWVFPDTFEKLIEAMLEHDDFGVVSPIQMQANMNHFDSYFRDVISRKYNENDLIELLMFKRPQQLLEVHDVMAAHWMISRKCFSCVGGFSPSFKHYGEDNNYSSRVIFKGMKNGVLLTAFAVHDREFRKISYKRQVFMDYIRTLVVVNDLNQNKILFVILKNIMYAIKKSLMAFSFYPLRCAIKLLFSYKEIKQNRALSKLNCAFLKK